MGFFKSLMSVISTDSKTGTPFNFNDNHTVFFKGNGVTKLDAARVAGYFKGFGYFTDTNQLDVQISSINMNDVVEVGFIMASKSPSSETESYLKSTLPGLENLFEGRTVTLHFLNINCEPIKKL